MPGADIVTYTRGGEGMEDRKGFSFVLPELDRTQDVSLRAAWRAPF